MRLEGHRESGVENGFHPSHPSHMSHMSLLRGKRFPLFAVSSCAVPAGHRPAPENRVNMRASFRLALVLAVALASVSCARQKPSRPAWFGACGELDVAELGEADIVPQLVERVAPKIEARPALGVVLLEVILDSSGRVCDARVVKPLEPQLDKAALEAVSQWKFSPARRKGKAVAARYFASVQYKRPGAPAEEEDFASPAHPPTNT